MGWRDVQAGVASGDISFKPEKDVFGSFASGALGGAIKKRDKEREDAIVAEKERKEQEKLTIKATAEQAKQEKKWKNQALYVMDSLGLQGGANSPDYADIFTSISSGISQSDVLTGLNTQITDKRRSIGGNGQFTNAAAPVTAGKRKLPDVSGDTPAQLDRKILAAAGDPELVAHYTKQRDMAGTQATTAATTEAATATSALYDEAAIMAASPANLLRMRLMAPPERHAAIDAAISGLPPEKGAQARYSTMSADDLTVALALATDEAEVALIKKAITARGTIVSDKDLPKVENVRYDNFEAYALAARNAGDETLAVQIETLGAAQVKKRADAEGVMIDAGASSFVVAYVDKADGETKYTTATATKNGKLFSHTLGRVVEKAPNSTPIDIEQQRDLYEDFTKLRPMVLPLEKKRKDLLATMTSAERLKDIVSENPAVLTTVGSMAKGVNRIGVEMATLVDMSKTASTSSVMDYIDSQAKSASKLSGIARAAALYEAEVLKFAYSYAASGLGQSGQGLSNTDFEKALLIVGTGATEGTFLTNLHARVSDSIKATDVVITDFSTSPEVDILSSISGDLLTSLKQPVSTYATTHGFEEMYTWASKEYVAAVEVVEAKVVYPKGVRVVTQAMADKLPGLAEWVGIPTFKNDEGKFEAYKGDTSEESQ